MRRFGGIFIGLLVIASGASGETKSISAKGYYTRVNDPELIELNSKRTLQPNFSRHIIYEHSDGTTESHWCSGSNILGKRSLQGGGGYCVILDEDGDGYWTWYEVVPGTGYRWKVMKGIGKFEGAEGSGVAESVDVLVDGSGVVHYLPPDARDQLRRFGKDGST